MAYLKVTKGSQLGEIFPLTGEKQTIGSSHRCDITVEGKRIAEFHASIFRDKDEMYYLRDSGSGQDTFVGGRKVHRSILRNKTSIKLGRTYLAFYVTDVPKEESKVPNVGYRISGHGTHPAIQAMQDRDEVYREEIEKEKKEKKSFFRR